LLAQLERAQPAFRAAGVRAVAVAMCQPRQAEAFCGSRAPGITCLCDQGRAAYAAYGLSRGAALQLMGPATIAAGVRAALSGHRQGRTVGDPAMMPGTFAVDADGIVRAVHYARHPGDQPDLPSLLAALR
jgi:hypothetical protein